MKIWGIYYCLVLTWVTLLIGGGCSPGSSTHPDTVNPVASNTSTSTTTGNTDTDSNESQQASLPTQVSGVYLTSCANIGYLGYGCSILDATTKAAISSGVSSPTVTIHYTNNTTSNPKVSQNKSGSQWLVNFPILASQIGLISSIEISASVAGKTQNLPAVPAKSIAVAPLSVASIPNGGNVVFVTQEVYLPGTANFVDWGMIARTCYTLGSASKVIPNADVLNWTALMSLEVIAAGGTSPNISNYLGTTSGAVVNTAGQVVATDMIKFWGPHLATIVTDENGAYVGDAAQVWTGSSAAGSLVTGKTCNSWQSTTGSAVIGLDNDINQWLNSGTQLPCTTPAHIYCFGTLP